MSSKSAITMKRVLLSLTLTFIVLASMGAGMTIHNHRHHAIVTIPKRHLLNSTLLSHTCAKNLTSIVKLNTTTNTIVHSYVKFNITTKHCMKLTEHNPHKRNKCKHRHGMDNITPISARNCTAIQKHWTAKQTPVKDHETRFTVPRANTTFTEHYVQTITVQLNRRGKAHSNATATPIVTLIQANITNTPFGGKQSVRRGMGMNEVRLNVTYGQNEPTETTISSTTLRNMTHVHHFREHTALAVSPDSDVSAAVTVTKYDVPGVWLLAILLESMRRRFEK